MALAQCSGVTALLIKDSGLKGRQMDLVDSYSQMVISIWELTKMTKLMAGVSCTRMMKNSGLSSWKASSKTIFSMVLAKSR